MIPSYFKSMDSEEFPVTRNGKVDRKKLETVEITTARARLESVDLNDDELEMSKLWCEVLQV